MKSAVVAAGQRLAVFVPNYNHARYLPFAIDALLAQSVQPREICILDDASTDDSRKVIAGYAAKHPHIRPVYCDRNRGVVPNMRDWLAQSRDEFVFFAAADDVVLPGLLQRSLDLLQTYPQAGLCSALSRLMDEEGRDLGHFLTPRPLAQSGYIAPELAAAALMIDDSWFMGNTTIYRREALEGAGGFDPELFGFSDGFVSRAIALKHGSCFIPDDLACWRRLRTGFAAQTIGSVKTAKLVADRAVTLMQTVHGGVFPAGYAWRWRRRWLFGTAMTLMGDAAYASRVSHLTALFDAGSSAKRLGVAILALLPRPLVSGLLLFAMRPWDFWSVVRRRCISPVKTALERLGQTLGHAMTGRKSE